MDTVPQPTDENQHQAPGVPTPEAAASLVQGTQLVRAHAKVFPTCGEAVIVYARPGSSSPGKKGEGADPEACAARSARRRRSEVRRYLIHNGLTRLWTLTYAQPVWDHDQVKADLARFFKALRGHRGGPFPYLWVIEHHPKGHGLHVHIAMKGYVRKQSLQALWGKGICHFSDRRRKAAEAYSGAQLAAYFAKELAGYITKEAARLDGKHFYDRAQGYSPPEVVEELQGVEASLIGHLAAAHFNGESPHRIWRSDELGDSWEGPPVTLLYWYGDDGGARLRLRAEPAAPGTF